MPETPITYNDVEVLRLDPLGMWCRIMGRRVYVESSVRQPGTTLEGDGTHGRLVVPKWFAVQEGLPLSPT
jgi:hypothetical protein